MKIDKFDSFELSINLNNYLKDEKDRYLSDNREEDKS